MAHIGADKTLQLIRESFYWPKMQKEVRNFINHQCPYVRQTKSYILGKAPLLPTTSSTPLEIVGIDFLHPKKSSGGFEYILLITDHFTKYTQAYPTCNKTAKTAAVHLSIDFALRFDIPFQLLHDQGYEFENALFKYLANFLDIQNL